MSPRYSHWLPKESPHRALEGSMSPGVTPEAVTYSRIWRPRPADTGPGAVCESPSHAWGWGQGSGTQQLKPHPEGHIHSQMAEEGHRGS